MCLTPEQLQDFPATVDWFYHGLLRAAAPLIPTPSVGLQRGLGGLLVYAGELDLQGCAISAAAQIAGAACLSAARDVESAQLAQRIGAVQMAAGSFDEARRSLKWRSSRGDAFALSAPESPEELERLLMENGLIPALLPSNLASQQTSELFLSAGARPIVPVAVDVGQVMLRWRLEEFSPRWNARIAALVATHLPVQDWENRRWLRMSSTVLAHFQAQAALVRCSYAVARQIIGLVQHEADRGSLPVSSVFQIACCGQTEEFLVQASAAATALPRLGKSTGKALGPRSTS